MTKRPVYTFKRAGEEGVPHLPAPIRSILDRLRLLNMSIPHGHLYKYMTATHAERMLDKGAVRVGTLEYYRAREAEEPLRGDAREGTAAYVEAPPGLQTAARLSARARSMWTPPSGVIAVGNAWIAEARHPNVFIYCVSHELSQAAAGGYDACVEITDVVGFFNELTLGLVSANPGSSSEPEVDISAVVYSDRNLPHELEGFVSPAFLKEPRFRVEAEIRAVWPVPRPAARTFCEFNRAALKQYIRETAIPAR